MFFQRSTFISLSIASLLCMSNAAPTTRSSPSKRQIAADTQSCTASDLNLGFLGATVDYTVLVGLPFQDGEGCNAIEDALSGALLANNPDFGNFFCVDDGFGDTKLTFQTDQVTGNGAAMNAALENVFANQIQGGFNCPDF